MKDFKLKHIQIQGDGIFGVLHMPDKNYDTATKIFKCAMYINGFLYYQLPKIDYRISLAQEEELMIVVGRDEWKASFFAGEAINKTKKTNG